MNKTRNIPLHGPENFEGMRKAGRLAAELLDYLTPFVQPGAVTEELDRLAHEFILDHGAIPAPLNYHGFPKSTCISTNHVVCHGIPSEKKLQNGDITNIDVTVILDGWYGDTSRMFMIGDKVPVRAQKLVEVTYEALMLGIEQVKPGATLRDVARAIETYAHNNRFSVVEDFCGHGLGREFHCAPSVLHYVDDFNVEQDTVLKPGMFFTIEPMLNAGTHACKVLNDGWTAVTRDRKASAQFEHSLAVTETGYEIFTLSPKGYTCPPYQG